MISRVGQTPLGQDALKTAFGEITVHHAFWHIGQSRSGQRRIEHLSRGVEGELTLDAHSQLAAAFLEFPSVHAAMRRQTQVDAVVPDELLRGLRRWLPLEIRGRADDRHPHVRSDPHGDHIFRHLLATAHASVILLCHDVGEAVVDDDLDLDVRVFSQQWRKLRDEDCLGRILGRCDPNSASWLFPKLTDGRDLRLDLVEAWSNIVKQTFPRFGWRDAPRGAAKKPNPEPLFEFSDCMARGGLGDAQLAGGLRETAPSRDGDKG